MNKTELVKELASRCGLSIAQAKYYFEVLINVVASGLKNDGELKIIDFMTIKAYRTRARMGHNPKTREKVAIDPKCKIRVTIGSKLSKYLNQ